MSKQPVECCELMCAVSETDGESCWLLSSQILAKLKEEVADFAEAAAEEGEAAACRSVPTADMLTCEAIRVLVELVRSLLLQAGTEIALLMDHELTESQQAVVKKTFPLASLDIGRAWVAFDSESSRRSDDSGA